MNDIQKWFNDLFAPGQKWGLTVIDVLLVTYLVYRLLKLIRGFRAWRVVFGVGVFILALVLTDFFELKTVHWLLVQATTLGPVALVVVFLPEIRQAIEGFTRLGHWSEKIIGQEWLAGDALEEIIAAVAEMAEQRMGALIVIERVARLDEVAANGVPVHAQVTAPLLASIFNEGGPMHDGAVIVRQGEILAAACRLPLSESQAIDPHFHMRHRAGVGISEQADCLVIIVSEERGKVSVAIDGKIRQQATNKDLRELLNQELRDGLSKGKVKRRGGKPGTKDAEGKVEKVSVSE